MQYIKFSCADFQQETKVEKKLAKNKKYIRKKAVDKSNGIMHHKYFYVFLFGSLLGTIYEEILMFFLRGYWISRSGVFWLPLNPLYGAGCLVFILVLSRFDKWYHQITYGAILGGSVEYFAHFFQQLITNTYSWDYSQKLTNIDGRTTVIYALVWGILGFLIYRYLYPLLLKLLKAIPYNIGEIITHFLKVLVFSVIAISFTAVIRYNLSTMGYEPLTSVGKFCDKYLGKDYIKKYYTNMRFK